MLFSTSLSGDNLQEFYNPKPFQFTCQTRKKTNAIRITERKYKVIL